MMMMMMMMMIIIIIIYSCKRLTVCKMGITKHLFRNERYVEALIYPFLFTVSIPKYKMCLINCHFE